MASKKKDSENKPKAKNPKAKKEKKAKVAKRSVQFVEDPENNAVFVEGFYEEPAQETNETAIEEFEQVLDTPETVSNDEDKKDVEPEIKMETEPEAEEKVEEEEHDDDSVISAEICLNNELESYKQKPIKKVMPSPEKKPHKVVKKITRNINNTIGFYWNGAEYD